MVSFAGHLLCQSTLFPASGRFSSVTLLVFNTLLGLFWLMMNAEKSSKSELFRAAGNVEGDVPPLAPCWKSDGVLGRSVAFASNFLLLVNQQMEQHDASFLSPLERKSRCSTR